MKYTDSSGNCAEKTCSIIGTSAECSQRSEQPSWQPRSPCQIKPIVTPCTGENLPATIERGCARAFAKDAMSACLLVTVSSADDACEIERLPQPINVRMMEHHYAFSIWAAKKQVLLRGFGQRICGRRRDCAPASNAVRKAAETIDVPRVASKSRQRGVQYATASSRSLSNAHIPWQERGHVGTCPDQQEHPRGEARAPFSIMPPVQRTHAKRIACDEEASLDGIPTRRRRRCR